MPNWTKGPWACQVDDVGVNVFPLGRGEDLGSIAVLKEETLGVLANSLDLDQDQCWSNAHLIAAAPELYEALASIENDDGRIPKTIWNMRNKALAKARGE